MSRLSNNTIGSVDIRFAETPIERDEVFRLRHRVLGSHSGTRSAGLTHANGRLLEPEDCGAQLLTAFDHEGRALAAIRRVPILRMLDSTESLKPLRRAAESLDRDLRRITVSSRFIIDPDTGGANLALRLFASMLRLGMQERLSHDICLCDQHRLQGRLRLGYKDLRVQMLDDRGDLQQILALPVVDQSSTDRPIVRLMRKVVNAA